MSAHLFNKYLLDAYFGCWDIPAKKKKKKKTVSDFREVISQLGKQTVNMFQVESIAMKKSKAG